MNEKVIVITGATSGIGKATALALGKKGATVIVNGRRQALLAQLASEIEAMGATSLAVAADVTDEAAIQQLADKVVAQFGKIDVWINNAAVTAFGEFTDIPANVFRRVMEVNVIGYANGARAALSYFKPQHHGILINVASVVGTIGQPYATPYTASKFAIRGFSEALRFEVEPYDIQVCTVLPGSIDTPLFQHAANYMGKAPKALTPVYAAQEVAEKVIDLIDNPKSEVYVGTMAALLANAHKFVPNLTAKTFASQVRKDHFQDKAADPTPGNVFTPATDAGETSGGWK